MRWKAMDLNRLFLLSLTRCDTSRIPPYTCLAHEFLGKFSFGDFHNRFLTDDFTHNIRKLEFHARYYRFDSIKKQTTRVK